MTHACVSEPEHHRLKHWIVAWSPDAKPLPKHFLNIIYIYWLLKDRCFWKFCVIGKLQNVNAICLGPKHIQFHCKSNTFVKSEPGAWSSLIISEVNTISLCEMSILRRMTVRHGENWTCSFTADSRFAPSQWETSLQSNAVTLSGWAHT